jgi:actin-related protein 5
MLREEGFENDAALDAAIKKLENDLKKSKKKDIDGDEMEASQNAYLCVLILISVV